MDVYPFFWLVFFASGVLSGFVFCLALIISEIG